MSLVWRGTHMKDSAYRTMCSSSEAPTMKNRPTLKYRYAFCQDNRYSLLHIQIIISPPSTRFALTTLPQLNGNISAMCDMSRNSIRQVISSENSAQKTISRRRPISGNRNRPTCTVPAEHSHARHAADDNCSRKCGDQLSKNGGTCSSETHHQQQAHNTGR